MRRVCLDCGSTIGKSSHAKRCEVCRPKHETAYNRVYHRNYNRQHPKYGRKTVANYRRNHPDRVRATQKKHGPVYRHTRNTRLKMLALSHYSKDPTHAACKRCGFDDIRALQIDHMYGGGRQHRIQLRQAGTTNFYQWLWKQDYPEGYQVLCANCNWIKRFENKENGGRLVNQHVQSQ